MFYTVNQPFLGYNFFHNVFYTTPLEKGRMLLVLKESNKGLCVFLAVGIGVVLFVHFANNEFERHLTKVDGNLI